MGVAHEPSSTQPHLTSIHNHDHLLLRRQGLGGRHVVLVHVQGRLQVRRLVHLRVVRQGLEEGAVSRPAYIHCAASRPSSRNSLPFEPTLMLPAFVPTFALVPVPLAFSTL